MATTTTAPEQLTLDVGGMSFAALAWGEEDAPLVLCLHGYPDTAWTYRHVGPLLAASGKRVVAIFTRGYGPTDLAPDGDYTLAALGRDAIAVRDHLGAGQEAALVGHDWGGATVVALAATDPGAFSKLASLAVPPFSALVAGRSLSMLGPIAKQLRLSWYIGFQQFPGISERQLPRVIPRLWKDWSPGYDGSEDVAHVFAALDSYERRSATLTYYRHNFATKAAKEIFAAPRQPLLHVRGAQDGCLGPELVDYASDHLPAGSKEVTVDVAGHFMTVEQPEAVARALTDWI